MRDDSHQEVNTPDGIFDLNSVSEEVLLEDDSPEHIKEKNIQKRTYQPMRKLNLTIEPIGFTPPMNSKPAQQTSEESESEFQLADQTQEDDTDKIYDQIELTDDSGSSIEQSKDVDLNLNLNMFLKEKIQSRNEKNAVDSSFKEKVR